jgi:hypothetical protein
MRTSRKTRHPKSRAMTAINFAIAATIAAAARRRREQQSQIPAPIHPNPRAMTATNFAIATIAAGAKLQLTAGQWQLGTGQWATLKSSRTVLIISERFGIYKVLLDGKQFSVDYKYVTVNA